MDGDTTELDGVASGSNRAPANFPSSRSENSAGASQDKDFSGVRRSEELREGLLGH